MTSILLVPLGMLYMTSKTLIGGVGQLRPSHYIYPSWSSTNLTNPHTTYPISAQYQQ